VNFRKFWYIYPGPIKALDTAYPFQPGTFRVLNGMGTSLIDSSWELTTDEVLKILSAPVYDDRAIFQNQNPLTVDRNR